MKYVAVLGNLHFDNLDQGMKYHVKQQILSVTVNTDILWLVRRFRVNIA